MNCVHYSCQGGEGRRASPETVWDPLRRGLACAGLTLLAGCVLGPAYHAPPVAQLRIPPAWHATLPHGGSMVELGRWWQQFDDPELSALIDIAEADSPTIGQAVARLRSARADLAVSRAAYLPGVDASGSFNRSNANTTAVTSANVNQPATVESGELNVTSGSLDVSWELDLFGKVRRRNQASAARAEAGLAEWHDARVSVAADVADAYARLRQCQALLQLQRVNEVSVNTARRITAAKVRFGFATPADAALTEASVDEASDSLEFQSSACEQVANELVALSGVDRTTLDLRLASTYGQIPVPRDATVPAIPAQVIEQRPDVRARERELAAANAEIGEAMAARLPSVSLTGSIGVNHYQASGQTLTLRPWAFGPGLTLPIFDGGRGAANVDAARAQYDETLGAYEETVRKAVMEVENALVRVDASVRREQAAAAAQKNYQRYFDATEQKYRTGAEDVLDLETARRQLVSDGQRVASARLERAQAWIALYKAVGGGWRETSSIPDADVASSTAKQ
jgi:outer membrane protein, multidrug efflux system